MKYFTLGSLAALFMLHGTAQATPISVPNSSFESPDVASTGTSIDNWTQFNEGSSGNGLIDESHVQIPLTADGEQWAYFFLGGAANRSIIWAQTGGTVSDNYNYTIDFVLGDRDTFDLPDEFKISIWAGDPGIGGIELDSTTINPTTLGIPNLGTSAQQAVLSTGTSGHVGDDLYIRFMSRDTSGNRFITLDGITLDGSPIPEPGSIGLLGLGVLLIGCVRQWKRHNLST